MRWHFSFSAGSMEMEMNCWGHTEQRATFRRKQSSGSVLSGTTANQAIGGNSESQRAGSSDAFSAEAKKARRLEQLRRGQQNLREKIKPCENMVDSLKEKVCALILIIH